MQENGDCKADEDRGVEERIMGPYGEGSSDGF